MEKKSLNLRYIPLKKALKTLESSVKRSHDSSIIDEFHQIRDSKIQRFEYTLDAFWKYVGDYLSWQGIELKQYSPKDVLRGAYMAKILHEDECNVLLLAVDDRNGTSHNYAEDLSEKIAKNIDTYYPVIASITRRLEPQESTV